MDITGVREQAGMLGGNTLFELTLEPSEGTAVALDMPVMHEAYDTYILWLWSQVSLEDTLRDSYYWELVASSLDYNEVKNPPSAQQLVDMAENRLACGNDPGFEQRRTS